MHSLLYIRPITGVGIRGSTYALLLLIQQINEHRQRRRRCNECRIQITIGKICRTSTGVRDNVVIVPLANSLANEKLDGGFPCLFRSCKLAPISFNLLSAGFFFFFFLFKRKQRLFHQYRFVCPPPVVSQKDLRSLVAAEIFHEFRRRTVLHVFNSFCADIYGFVAYRIIVSLFFFSSSRDRNLDENHPRTRTSMRIFIKQINAFFFRPIVSQDATRRPSFHEYSYNIGIGGPRNEVIVSHTFITPSQHPRANKA